MIPYWNKEGEPENLAAATKDAEEWLVMLRRNAEVKALLSRHPSSEERLDRAISALHQFLDAPIPLQGSAEPPR